MSAARRGEAEPSPHIERQSREPRSRSVVAALLRCPPAVSAPRSAVSTGLEIRTYSMRGISILIIGLLWATSSAQTTDRAPIKRDRRYPAHWWAPISDPNKPDWEILPQEAGPGEVILSKRHELGLLSNFAATPFTYRGKRYASLEGFWQMMLYPEGPNDPRAQTPRIEWKYTRDEVAQMTAFEAKAAGTLAEQYMEIMGIDWVTFEGKKFKYRSQKPGEHYRLIVEATREKVKQNPEVRRVLLATGDLILKPDHHGETNAPPEWRYYEILMTIRKELQVRR